MHLRTEDKLSLAFKAFSHFVALLLVALLDPRIPAMMLLSIPRGLFSCHTIPPTENVLLSNSASSVEYCPHYSKTRYLFPQTASL